MPMHFTELPFSVLLLHLLEFLPLGSAPCIAAAAPFPDVPAKSFCEYVWTIKWAWWLPPPAAMTTPQRWMIRPTYTLLLLLFLLLPLLQRLLLLLPCVSSTCAWLPGWVPWCVAVGRVALAGSAILGAPMVCLQRCCWCDVCFRCLPLSAAVTTPRRWMIQPTHCVIVVPAAVVPDDLPAVAVSAFGARRRLRSEITCRLRL